MKLVFFFFFPPFSFVVGQTFLSGVKHRPAGGFGMVTGSSGRRGGERAAFIFDLLLSGDRSGSTPFTTLL